MGVHDSIYVFLTENCSFIKLYASGKDYLHKSATCKLAVRLIRLAIINVLNLSKSYTESLHKLVNKLNCILKSSCTSYLKKHRKLIKLRIIGKVSEVILVNVIGLGNKSQVNGKSLTLKVDSRALSTSLSKRFVVPACSGLNALVGKKVILKSAIVILNLTLGLNKSRSEGASISDKNNITLCCCDGIISNNGCCCGSFGILNNRLSLCGSFNCGLFCCYRLFCYCLFDLSFCYVIVIVEEYLFASNGLIVLAIDNFAYVCFADFKSRVILNAGRKDNLNYTALSKTCIGLVRHMVVSGRNLALCNTELAHNLCDKLKCILKSSVALNLKKHRKCCELGVIGKIGEVILAYAVFLRIKRKIESE